MTTGIPNLPRFACALPFAFWLALGNASATAQGTLKFINSAATRVKTPDGANITVAMGYRVELAWGWTETTVTNSGYYTGFSSIAGIFNGGILTLPGTLPGDRPWITIRVWDTKGGTLMTWEQALVSPSYPTWGSCTWQLGSGLGGPNPPHQDIPPSPLTGFVAPTLFYPLPVPILVRRRVPILNVKASGALVQFELEGNPAYGGYFEVWLRTSLDADARWQFDSHIDDASSRKTVIITNDVGVTSRFFKAVWCYYDLYP